MNTKQQRLRDACQRGDFKGLLHRARASKSNKLLKEPFDPDLSQPLHYAAALGNLEVVRELIESYDCEPMCQNVHGITPLHCASYCGKIKVVKYLQELYGIAVVVVDKMGACPIAYCTYCAIWAQSVEAPLDHYLWRRISPSSDHVEVAKYLLSLRVQNINQVCRTLSPKLVQVLRLPMHCGSLTDFKCIIEMLTQFDFQAESAKYNTEVYECLCSAIRSYKWDFVRALLSAFLDPIKVAATTIDHSSQSFLHNILFKEADVDLIKLFLEHEITNKPDLLSLKLAIDRNCYELVQYLLESTDQLSVMDEYEEYSGYSSLLSYIFSSFEYKSREQSLVKLIADHGAGSRDIDGNTVLHLACKYSVKFIIEDNYDQSVVNNKGQVPLHIACKHGNLEIIKLVSSQPGFNVNFQDSAGIPLYIRHANLSGEGMRTL